jgi:3-oxoadipate enol-lactonase
MSLFKTQNYEFSYSVVENVWSHDLIFLNGNLATTRWWLPTVEFLKTTHAPAAKTGRFIFLDLPGCGEGSAVTSSLNSLEIARQYLDLLSNLAINQGSIVGHSTGGLLAGLMMAERPEIFKSALLLDPVGAKGIQFDDTVLQKYEEMKTSRDLTAAIIGFTIQDCDTTSAFFQDVIVEDTWKSVKNVGSRMILALRGANFSSTLKQVKTPTTILFGEHDFLLPKSDAQDLTQIFQTAQFIEVAGAGHCLNVERPALMADFIKKYVG